MIEQGRVQGRRPGSKATQSFFCKMDGTASTTDKFNLIYGYQETPVILASASATTLRRALQKLHSAGKISVLLNSGAGTTVCDATTPVEIEITFEDAHGPIPVLDVVGIVSGGGVGNGMSATNSAFGTVDFTATSISTGSLLKYGQATSVALKHDMWDADMLYGCLCDGYSSSGLFSDDGDLGKYKGPECQLQNCPTGADPHQLYTATGCSAYNTLLHAENATITCEATGGTFTLTFRGQQTTPISHSASTAALESALEAISTITDVKVTSSAATVCAGSAVTSEITFVDPPGNVPALEANTRKLTSTSFSIVHTDAPGRMAVCGGRGVCDEEAGVCKCHTGYASSNGFGGRGTRGDCGHLLDASEIRKVDQNMWLTTWRTEV